MLKDLVYSFEKGFYMESWDDNFVSMIKIKFPFFVNGMYGLKITKRSDDSHNLKCKLYDIQGYNIGGFIDGQNLITYGSHFK